MMRSESGHEWKYRVYDKLHSTEEQEGQTKKAGTETKMKLELNDGKSRSRERAYELCDGVGMNEGESASQFRLTSIKVVKPALKIKVSLSSYCT